MRRADRLFQLVQVLRGRRHAVTALRLGELLGVSMRTVYRDIADLQASGVQIEGEAGVGYVLRRGSDIPPLMFSREEMEALVVGARITDAFAGARLSGAARQALIKIEAVLPEDLKRRSERSRVLAPRSPLRARDREYVDVLHAAIEQHRVVGFDYQREDGTPSRREIEPLCLLFWGPSWTVGAWCRWRGDFRNFRLDRMMDLSTSEETFEETATRGLRAYLAANGGDRELEI